MSSSIKTIIAVTVFTAAVFAGVVMFYFHIASVNAKAVRIEREVETAQAQQNEFQSIKEVLENNRGDIEALRTYLIPEDGVPAFLSRIESLSTTTGADITTRSVTTADGQEEKENQQMTETLNLTVSIGGRWEEVFHSIALIETLPLKLHIKTLNLSRAGEAATSSWQATAELEILKKASL